MQTEEVPLKFQKIDAQSLILGDIVLHEGQLWQCNSVQMQLFIDIYTRKKHEYIKLPQLTRVNKLELIPKEWKFQQGRITLKGQQLGLGPTHEIQIDGMRAFDEMEVVKSQMAKGRRIEYKVILCETAVKKLYLMVAVKLL